MNNISVLGKDCCGCAGCEQVCPKRCISLTPDGEGFFYPRVDSSKCVDCGLCVKKCPLLSDVKRGERPEVYAAKLKDKAAVNSSSSGGVFTALAEYVLEKNGVVFGCAFDNSLVARHIAVESREELEGLKSSKYVQSDTRGIYSAVKAALDSGKTVLFSGVGCQAAGLRAFLGKEYENLIIADIVCHGAPSPKLFAKYLEYKGGELGGKITSYNFRSKEKRGWDLYYKAETAAGSKTDYGFFDPYYNAFLTGKTYRESCYVCKFANSRRPGDITLADYWGVGNYHPDFYDRSGVSLVLLNTDRGRAVWQELGDRVEAVGSKLEYAAVMNKNLTKPTERPECRSGIYEGLDGDLERYFKTKLKFSVNPKTKLKKLIPVGLIKRIKK